MTNDATHEWFTPRTAKWEACRRCGIVRRADRQNKPCKGDVFVRLREKGSVVPGEQTSEPETPKAGNGEYAVRLSAAIAALYAAHRDLLAQGWRDAIYAPKDGTMIEIICLGSTGMFKASWQSFGHQPLDGCGCFFAEDGGDLYPTEIAVWRPITN